MYASLLDVIWAFKAGKSADKRLQDLAVYLDSELHFIFEEGRLT